MRVSVLLGGERAPSVRLLTRPPAVRPPETSLSGVTSSLAAPLTCLWAADIPERDTREWPLAMIPSDSLNRGEQTGWGVSWESSQIDEAYWEGALRTSEPASLHHQSPLVHQTPSDARFSRATSGPRALVISALRLNFHVILQNPLQCSSRG